MTTTTPTSKLKTAVTSQTLTSNGVQMAAALILGVVVLVGVGFAPMDAAHNAAPDTRHSVAFPCH